MQYPPYKQTTDAFLQDCTPRILSREEIDEIKGQITHISDIPVERALLPHIDTPLDMVELDH